MLPRQRLELDFFQNGISSLISRAGRHGCNMSRHRHTCMSPSLFKDKKGGFFAFLFKNSIRWSQIIALFNLRFYTISAWEKRSFSFKDDGLLAGFLTDVTGFHQIQFQ